MPHTRYFVVRHADQWMIRYNEADYGPYSSRAEAMLFAVDAAKKRGSYGETAEVCIMGENGHFHPEWTTAQHDHCPQM